MPAYDATCPSCMSETEVTCAIKDRDIQRCPCGGILMRIIKTPPLVKNDDEDFSNENSGRGRYNPQTKMWHRDVRSVIDEGKRRGWEASRG